MDDLELYEYRNRLNFLQKRTRSRRIWWKLNNKIIIADLELQSRGY